jgi:integrase
MALESQQGERHGAHRCPYQVAEMFRELKALAGDSELVLPGRGSTTRPFAKNALNSALEGLTFEGMDPLTIHDLRRTGATLLTTSTRT